MNQSIELEAVKSLRGKGEAHPASKAFRDCRAQVHLALSQREEDPARVWLELVQVRESAALLAPLAKNDPILFEEIDRFRAKLEAEVFALTQEVGDEVLAPLYVWLDLIKRRNELDRDILTARQNVKTARAARRDKGRAPRTTEESEEQLETVHAEIARWKSTGPAPPSPRELDVWRAGGWESKGHELPQDDATILARGAAARAVVDAVDKNRALGALPFAGGASQKATLGFFGAVAVGASVGAAATSSIALGVVACVAWVVVVVAAVASMALRETARREREAAVYAVHCHRFVAKRIELLEVESGWLRALLDGFRARHAFDESKAEGKQIEDLKAWRPDLRDFVVEVARLREDPSRAKSQLQSLRP